MRVKSARFSEGFIVLFLMGVLLVGGCEDDITLPPVHEYPFTMYGVINPVTDTQYVHVFPVETTLTPGTPVPLAARFTSEDLVTGERRDWRDSVLVDSSGVVNHLYYSPFRAAYDHTYRVQIERSDGATSSAVVSVPTRTRLVMADPDTLPRVTWYARIEGSAPVLHHTRMVYFVVYLETSSTTEAGCSRIRYHMPYDDRVIRSADGLDVTLEVEADYFRVRGAISTESRYSGSFFIVTATFETTVANKEWLPPGGVFDPDVMVQPGVMDNVENGFGFVGAGYMHGRDLSDYRVLRKAGFIPLNVPCIDNRPIRDIVLNRTN